MSLARRQYKTEPEYLWAKYPDYAVLRHADNRKWYAVLMNVAREKLGLPGEGEVDIIDLKLDPELIGALRMSPGFLPAYHMNKSSWITVLLDGTVGIGQIADLVDASYRMTAAKK